MTIKTVHTISCDNWPNCHETCEIEDTSDYAIRYAGFVTDDDGYHFCLDCEHQLSKERKK